MYIPTYGGSAIFGRSTSMLTSSDPACLEYFPTFGVSGLVELYGDQRRTMTLATFLLSSPDLPGFNLVESMPRSLNDGVARPLLDHLGVTYPQVLLRQYHPIPGQRIMLSPSGYVRWYRATLLHLS